jgi:cytoskeletal protein CcmA (bactofilin family)
MFGGEKNKSTRAPAGVETLIGSQVTIRGDLHFTGGLYIEGSVHGSVVADDGQSDSVLTLAEKGLIRGEVHAPHVIVNGQLDGDVHASERIELGANARVQGNIHYKVVEMAAGATITGRLIHADAPKALPRLVDQASGRSESADDVEPAVA